MFGFLENLTQRLRKDRNERLKRIGESGERMRRTIRGQQEGEATTPSPLTEKIRESTRGMQERIEVKREEQKTRRERMRAEVKKPKTRMMRIVEFLHMLVSVVPAMLITELGIWPGPAIREGLAGIGFRGEFFTYFVIAFVFFIVLIPLRIGVARYLQKKYPPAEEELNTPPRY